MDIPVTNCAAHVLFSGGIDSLSCAHLLMKQGFDVTAVFVDYGQAALESEERASQALARHLAIPRKTVGSVQAEKFGSGELVGRNMFLISAALFGVPVVSGILAIGIHAGTPYYDCSRSFIDSMARLISEQTNGRVALVAPFLDWTKIEIYKYAVDHSLPFDSSYSCEGKSGQPCGECLSCRDRMLLRDLQTVEK